MKETSIWHEVALWAALFVCCVIIVVCGAAVAGFIFGLFVKFAKLAFFLTGA